VDFSLSRWGVSSYRGRIESRTGKTEKLLLSEIKKNFYFCDLVSGSDVSFRRIHCDAKAVPK
jgi:hypothetical protein